MKPIKLPAQTYYTSRCKLELIALRNYITAKPSEMRWKVEAFEWLDDAACTKFMYSTHRSYTPEQVTQMPTIEVAGDVHAQPRTLRSCHSLGEQLLQLRTHMVREACHLSLLIVTQKKGESGSLEAYLRSGQDLKVLDMLIGLMHCDTC